MIKLNARSSKICSMLLAAVMIVSMFAAAPVTVRASGEYITITHQSSTTADPGDTVAFEAKGYNSSNAEDSSVNMGITWSVSGGNSADTKITNDISDASGSSATLEIGSGETAASVTVTAANVNLNISNSATVTVNQPSSDATLQSLTVNQGALSPLFNPNTTNYTVSVDNSVTLITVTAIANGSAYGAAVTAGNGTHNLNVGANIITVTVTAQDGTAQAYIITVTRAAAGGGSGSSSRNRRRSSDNGDTTNSDVSIGEGADNQVTADGETDPPVNSGVTTAAIVPGVSITRGESSFRIEIDNAATDGIMQSARALTFVENYAEAFANGYDSASATGVGYAAAYGLNTADAQSFGRFYGTVIAQATAYASFIDGGGSEEDASNYSYIVAMGVDKSLAGRFIDALAKFRDGKNSDKIDIYGTALEDEILYKTIYYDYDLVDTSSVFNIMLETLKAGTGKQGQSEADGVENDKKLAFLSMDGKSPPEDMNAWVNMFKSYNDSITALYGESGEIKGKEWAVAFVAAVVSGEKKTGGVYQEPAMQYSDTPSNSLGPQYQKYMNGETADSDPDLEELNGLLEEILASTTKPQRISDFKLSADVRKGLRDSLNGKVDNNSDSLPLFDDRYIMPYRNTEAAIGWQSFDTDTAAAYYVTSRDTDNTGNGGDGQSADTNNGSSGQDAQSEQSLQIIGDSMETGMIIADSFGGVLVNPLTASNLSAINLKEGSVILSFELSGSKKEPPTPNAPLIIFMPNKLETTEQETIVMYETTTGKTVAHSFCQDGFVLASVLAPGHYDVRSETVNYSDTEKHWAESGIAFAASRGLISSVDAETFAPDEAITRADFIMALGVLSGADMSGYRTSSFKDVQSDDPAMPYIEWAVRNGIVQGIGDNCFAPENAITREQMAVMMANYTKVTNQPLPVTREDNIFADDAEISRWAAYSVMRVQWAGVMQGKPGNLFDPKGSATRAEACEILSQFARSVVIG